MCSHSEQTGRHSKHARWHQSTGRKDESSLGTGSGGGRGGHRSPPLPTQERHTTTRHTLCVLMECHGASEGTKHCRSVLNSIHSRQCRFSLIILKRSFLITVTGRQVTRLHIWMCFAAACLNTPSSSKEVTKIPLPAKKSKTLIPLSIEHACCLSRVRRASNT